MLFVLMFFRFICMLRNPLIEFRNTLENGCYFYFNFSVLNFRIETHFDPSKISCDPKLVFDIFIRETKFISSIDLFLSF